jgi:hypothetical protein
MSSKRGESPEALEGALVVPGLVTPQALTEFSDQFAKSDMHRTRTEDIERAEMTSCTAAGACLVHQSVSNSAVDENNDHPQSVTRGEMATANSAPLSPFVHDAEDEGRRKPLEIQPKVLDGRYSIDESSESHRSVLQVEYDREFLLAPEQDILDGQLSDCENRSLLNPEYVNDRESIDSVNEDSKSRRSVIYPEYSGFEAITQHNDFVDSDCESGRSVLQPMYVNNPGKASPLKIRNTAPVAEGLDYVHNWEGAVHDRTSELDHSPPHNFRFIEFNGMRTSVKATTDMDEYLKRRRKWRGMIIKDGVSKTMRFENITKHMISGLSQDYLLVKVPYEDHFTQVKAKRRADDNEDTSRLAYSDKRQRSS